MINIVGLKSIWNDKTFRAVLEIALKCSTQEILSKTRTSASHPQADLTVERSVRGESVKSLCIGPKGLGSKDYAPFLLAHLATIHCATGLIMAGVSRAADRADHLGIFGYQAERFPSTQHCFNSCLLFYLNYPLHLQVQIYTSEISVTGGNP
jgi:hypothetical protein